jgi:CubicO group peptidase (beta-lactamase class C family)
MTVSGTCDERFASVADQFQRNFSDHGELGASVSITVEGETVVDLWGGTADASSGRVWDRDTVSLVWSCTKGATALCAHILASRGLLDVDAPVVQYWPEYATFGKEKTTVRMLLAHQSGLSALAKPLPDGAFYEWDTMIAAIESAEPMWQPGTRHGYQAFTFGWLIGELVRRISGRSLGAFFQSEVAEPLGLDFWIGLPEEIEPRVAPMVFPTPEEVMANPSIFFVLAGTSPESVPALIMANNGGYMTPGPTGFDGRPAHAAEIGAAGGITHARSLARMYAPLANGGALAGVQFVDKAALARMTTPASVGADAAMMSTTRFTLGYIKSHDNRRQPEMMTDSAVLSADAFGHPGFGGSIGFASPANRVSFAYTMNRMGVSTMLDVRGQGLVDALYRSLGYTNNSAEIWQ